MCPLDEYRRQCELHRARCLEREAALDTLRAYTDIDRRTLIEGLLTFLRSSSKYSRNTPKTLQELARLAKGSSNRAVIDGVKNHLSSHWSDVATTSLVKITKRGDKSSIQLLVDSLDQSSHQLYPIVSRGHQRRCDRARINGIIKLGGTHQIGFSLTDEAVPKRLAMLKAIQAFGRVGKADGDECFVDFVRARMMDSDSRVSMMAMQILHPMDALV